MEPRPLWHLRVSQKHKHWWLLSSQPSLQDEHSGGKQRENNEREISGRTGENKREAEDLTRKTRGKQEKDNKKNGKYKREIRGKQGQLEGQR